MVWIKQRRSLLAVPRWQAIALFLFVMILAGIAGQSDFEHAQMEEEHYCDMVALWKADAAAGIRAEDRRGWPEFKKGEVTCQ